MSRLSAVGISALPAQAVAECQGRGGCQIVDEIDSAHIVMKCPAHNGAFKSSLEVTLRAGVVDLHCMCGCPEDRILATALGEQPQQQRDAVEAFIDALDIA